MDITQRLKVVPSYIITSYLSGEQKKWSVPLSNKIWYANSNKSFFPFQNMNTILRIETVMRMLYTWFIFWSTKLSSFKEDSTENLTQPNLTTGTHLFNE